MNDTSSMQGEIAIATRLGFELGKAEGRKEAGEEIAAAIMKAGDERSKHRDHDRPAVSRLGAVRHASYLDAAAIARNLVSQPQEAPSEPLTPSTSHSDLPEGGEAL